MPYDYRREGFNCGVCKAQGKEQINLMRPQFSNSRYNRETGQFLHFKDEDVTVTVPITSRHYLNLHKQREHPVEFIEARDKARETRRRNSY